MRAGRPPVPARAVVLLLAAVLLLATALGATGCTRVVDGAATAAPVATPAGVAELGGLVVTEVPWDLPRLADEALDPPAGPKSVDDVATYADDPDREREVLAGYGYRHGWERFWGAPGGELTGVFVDQFEHRAGAGAYAEDLARNDADHYRGVLAEDPAGLPGGCWSLTVADPDPDVGLGGPAAFAWCGHGVFSVGVTVVAASVDAAEEQVRAVLAAQLDRLPPR